MNMKLIIRITLLMLTATATHATLSDTDRYIAFLADLLERKAIGDDELVQLIENAEQGKVINPISQERADIRVSDFIDHEVAQKWVDEAELDPLQVAKWAQENLAEQERIRKKRKQVKQDTKRVWKPQEPSFLSAGVSHNCAVTVDGTVKCWGFNEDGKLNVPADLGVVRSVAAGSWHTCALKPDGEVRCWGNNIDAKGRVPPDLGAVQSIFAGDWHTCAIRPDQTLRCWGALSDDPWPSFSKLGLVQSGSAADWGTTCIVRADGTSKCFSAFLNGWQDIPLGNIGLAQSLSIGAFSFCALLADNTVRCLGKFVEPKDLGIVSSISVGIRHGCAIRSDRTVSCWGENGDGQTDVPSDLGVVRSISAGDDHTCAVKDDGAVRCWGKNDYGQIDVPEGLVVMRGSQE